MVPGAVSAALVAEVRVLLDQQRDDAAWERIAFAPVLAAAVAANLGDTPISLGAGFYRTSPARAWPGASPLNPHLHDHELLTEPPDKLLFAWVALQDIAATDGPMWIEPGSHRRAAATHADVHRVLEVERPGAHAAMRNAFADHPAEGDLPAILDDYHLAQRSRLAAEPATPRPVLLEAGDALLFDPGLLHGTFPPADPERPPSRFAGVLRYAAASAALFAFPPWQQDRMPDPAMRLPDRRRTIPGGEVYPDYVRTRLGALGVQG